MNYKFFLLLISIIHSTLPAMDEAETLRKLFVTVANTTKRDVQTNVYPTIDGSGDTSYKTTIKKNSKKIFDIYLPKMQSIYFGPEKEHVVGFTMVIAPRPEYYRFKVQEVVSFWTDEKDALKRERPLWTDTKEVYAEVILIESPLKIHEIKVSTVKE